MECPFCGGTMEKGKIYVRQDLGLPWIPETEKRPYAFSAKTVAKRKGILLCEQKFFPPDAVKMTTYICRSCKKGIVEY